MGSGHGGGYATSPSGFHVLAESIRELAKKYPLDHLGRFGTKDRGSQVIRSSDPLATCQEFWVVLRRGGRIVPLPNGHGERAIFDDGSHVVHRPYKTKDGSPAVEIVIATSGQGRPSRQKIHFILKGQGQ